MKTLLALLFLGGSSVLFAAQSPPSPIAATQLALRTNTPPATASPKTPPPRRSRLLYQPPRLNAPKVTTGPGTRGNADALATLALFTPEHTALTTLAQPTLAWYLLNPSQHPVQFTLVIPGQPQPVLQLDRPAAAQNHPVQMVNLKHHGVQLTPGIRYRWSVALITDPQHPSKDLVASSVIERRPPSTAPAPLPVREPDWDHARVAAEMGVWHDAVGILLSLPSPEKWTGLEQLARQVGLKEVADFCRQETVKE